jgi:hypothetical protein
MLVRLASVSALLVPLAASAAGPPLSVPPSPAAPPSIPTVVPPPTLPVLDAPPVLELVLPSPAGSGSGGAGFDIGAAGISLAVGPPDPTPPVSEPGTLPDLTGLDLPSGAAHVFDHAPPFGGAHPSAPTTSSANAPEPATGSILLIGLASLAALRRRERTRATP